MNERQRLASLFEKHHARLLTVVRRELGPGLRRKLDSADVLQGAMLDALESPDTSLATDDDFISWMARVIEDNIKDRARFYSRRKRDVALELPLPLSESALGGHGGTTPSGVVALQEAEVKLARAFSRLKKADQNLVHWSRIEGKTAGEIAALTGKSLDAAKKALTRALARLAEEMGH